MQIIFLGGGGGGEEIKLVTQSTPTQLEALTLLPTAFYDFLSYGGGIFIPHPIKQC